MRVMKRGIRDDSLTACDWLPCWRHGSTSRRAETVSGDGMMQNRSQRGLVDFDCAADGPDSVFATEEAN